MGDAARAGTNRYGLVGDFEAYAPPRLGLDEILSRARRSRSGAPPEGRVSQELAKDGGYAMVRYRLGSDEMRRDAVAVAPEFHVAAELANRTAVFGVLDAAGTPRAMIQAYRDPRTGDRVQDLFGAPGHGIPPEVMARFLGLVDAPPSHEAASAGLELFDIRFDGADGWLAAAPRHLVRVTFERVCFATRPVLRESTDVLVPLQPGHDVDDPDPERADDARHRYRSFAMGELRGLGSGVRPGFSSWMATGDAVVVKVVGAALDAEVARLGADDAEEPDAPRP